MISRPPYEITKDVEWRETKVFDSVAWRCGYCDHEVGSNVGYFGRGNVPEAGLRLYICPNCKLPTVFSWDVQWHAPSAVPGKNVEHLPSLIDALYREARAATGAGAYTAAVLACRTILMHLAVEKRAPENKTFAFYIDYLDEMHYFSPETKSIAMFIKDRGNDATHEIRLMSEQDAEAMIYLTGHLLETIYASKQRIPSGPWHVEGASTD